MSDRMRVAEMPKLHPLDEEFEEDVDADVHGRRGKIVQRLLMLAVVALGAGTIAALALAWSAADGPLRLEPQSMAPSPRTVAREAAEEKVDRLRRQMDALQNASTAGVRSYLVARAHQRRHLLRTLRLMHGALASLPRAFGPTSTIETPS